MEVLKGNKDLKKLRVIKTARSVEAINMGAKEGYWPLIKKVIPLDKIRTKYAVYQDSVTGEVTVIGDYRMSAPCWTPGATNEKVIDWTFYYPHSFESPFAAYLIPNDLEVGELVFVEDLIEDIVGTTWNQGDCYRLESCNAKWNGKELEIQFDPKVDRMNLIG